ncbi:MAG: hypothetical protein J5490_01965 [Bacteroidales bacterium]|nr:hypothetical protein [Bacteroidales bacterium]
MSCYDTCFFERYAHQTLRRFLGHEYDDLVNRDRPDLQSPDGRSLGIEVTRAMEETQAAAEQLLDNMSGFTHMPSQEDDFERFILSGYSYGLDLGRFLSPRESRYWSMALPMKRILESKVSKMVDGFYGDFDRSGLYVFCKDDIGIADIIGAYRRVMALQRYSELRYNYLFLSEVNCLHVCNLSERISDTYRVSSYDISLETRREIYGAALEAT